MDLERLRKALIVLDLLIFLPVVFLFVIGGISSSIGIAVLFSWVIVFFATVIAFSANLSEGSSEWYDYSMTLIVAILMAVVVGLVLGYDFIGILILIPFAVILSFALKILFIDFSESEFEKDLKRLQKEIK